MFENFIASVAPNSLNLKRYLTKSKPLTKIKTKMADAILRKLNDEYWITERKGYLATAMACSGTVVCITDEDLAKSLYLTVTSEKFREKLIATCNNINCSSDIKFFINKKKQQLVFIYYKCELDWSKHFLATVYDSLQQLVELFSTNEYKINVNYEIFFSRFLGNDKKTTFLTSFFTSLVANEYSYTPARMMLLSNIILGSDKLSSDVYTHVPGMYIEPLDNLFKNSLWPRNIHINLLKLRSNQDAFNSYADLFTDYSTPTDLSTFKDFDTDTSFVFDEHALIAELASSGNSNELETYTVLRNCKYVVIKIKDITLASKYLNVLQACVNSNFLDAMTIVPTATKDAIYLFFTLPDGENLKHVIKSWDSLDTGRIIQQVSKTNWSFAFKPHTSLVECFYATDNTFKLNPSYLSELDFSNEGRNLDYRILVLHIVEEFVKSKGINVNFIYEYNFMKILPPTFAKHLIEYLTSGNLPEDSTDSWGDVLSFDEFKSIKFVTNFNAEFSNYVSFFPDAKSDPNVQAILSFRPKFLEDSYISSDECLEYIEKIGRDLTDSTLKELFASDSNDYLRPTAVIVSTNDTGSNSYHIIGVQWNKCNLTTIGNLIDTGKVDTIVFYKLLTSLCSKQMQHSWLIDANNIRSMLVDLKYNVFLNYNGLHTTCNNRNISYEGYFNILFFALDEHLDDKSRKSLERFEFCELYDNGNSRNAKNVLLCGEHNRYHIEGTLCPECKKIYQLVPLPTTNKIYGENEWCFYYSKKCIIACSRTLTLSNARIASFKLGITNSLFDKFFFKPKKLAYANGHPFGVIFDKLNFDHILPIELFTGTQRLQVVLVMYKKLLPLILDGSLITSSKKLFESIAMHRLHKGELLILKLPFMNCQAVLNKDQKAIEKTKLVFAEFLTSYIKNDSSLLSASNVKDSEISRLIKDIANLKFSQDILKECISAFCAIHNIPFSAKNSLCPLCLADGINNEVAIIKSTSYFENLMKKGAAFEGGEATLYPYSNGAIQKLFKPGVDLVLKSKIIGKALQKADQFKSFNSYHTDIKFITIDGVLYESYGNSIKLRGFVQDCIEDSFKISCLRDKEFVTSHGYTRSDIIEILIKVCIGIEFLHSIGGYIGDLNGGNILIKDKAVYFIDMDGMSFDKVKNFVYTDLYIYPPSVEAKNITKDDDWYSLAIQAFYYFTYSHPFRGISNSKLVPSDEIVRMKSGMSVLGNHGIKVPNISIGWQFMSNDLINFFKTTFEGHRRESMRTVLEEFKKLTTASEEQPMMEFTKLTRQYSCHFALSYNTYIDTSRYLVWCEQKLLRFASGTISCKKSGDYIVLTTPNQSVVLNDITGVINTYSAICKDDISYGANNKLFYIDSSDHNVYVKQISRRTDVESNNIVVQASAISPFDFLVTDEHKFIFLVRENSYVSIFCNLDKLTNVDVSDLGDNYTSRIFYDSASENYLVLLAGNNQTRGVVISSDGSYSSFTLDIELSNSCCFFKNTLYYINDSKVCFYNVINGNTNSFTSQYASQGCLVERRDNRFVICNKDTTYICVKS